MGKNDTISLGGKLSAVQVKQAKPKCGIYKLSDGHGLNLEVRPNGSKYWRLAYRYQNKQNTLALGVYPVVTLLEARRGVLMAKRLLYEGTDPAVHKRQEKAARREALSRRLPKNGTARSQADGARITRSGSGRH